MIKSTFLGLVVALFLVVVSSGCGKAPVSDTAAQAEGAGDSPLAGKSFEILNVSYDPTREFYQEFNQAFSDYAKEAYGISSIKIDQSHGGSGKQARSVIDGLKADVVTLALAYDIDELVTAGLIEENWQSELQNNSSPYTSTIVLLVRKGNPKGIKDWDDLVKPGVKVITPNPKTSGGARWNYLAAWGYALRQPGGSPASAQEFVKKLYQNVPILDTGARGSLTTFVQRGLGDVFISWENEALLTLKEFGEDKYEIVYPSVSILAEPPVAVVDKNVDQRNTREIATAYLEYLYSETGQKLAAKHFYRPQDKSALSDPGQFPAIELFTIDEVFGGWKKAQQDHFNDGGIFDLIYQEK